MSHVQYGADVTTGQSASEACCICGGGSSSGSGGSSSGSGGSSGSNSNSISECTDHAGWIGEYSVGCSYFSSTSMCQYASSVS